MLIFYIMSMAPIKPMCQNYIVGNGTVRHLESKILVFTIWDLLAVHWLRLHGFNPWLGN